MKTLLIVHHTPSPAMQELLEASRSGASTEDVTGVDTITRPALSASAADVLEADAVLLGTPANIGYMSGALKHFFDTVYYPCLEAKPHLPYALYVHGDNDVTGAVRSVESITKALTWRPLRPPLTITGPDTKTDLAACWELGALLAAEIGELA